MKRKDARKTIRRGFSFLELQVSLILVGIVLGAIVPLVLMQSKQLKLLEYRWDENWSEEEAELDYWIDPHLLVDVDGHEGPEGPVYYLVPPIEMAGDLGVPALLKAKKKTDGPPVPPGSGLDPSDILKNTVESAVLIDGDTASIQVTPIPET